METRLQHLQTQVHLSTYLSAGTTEVSIDAIGPQSAPTEGHVNTLQKHHSLCVAPQRAVMIAPQSTVPRKNSNIRNWRRLEQGRVVRQLNPVPAAHSSDGGIGKASFDTRQPIQVGLG